MKKTLKMAAVPIMALMLVMPLGAEGGISPDTVIGSFLGFMESGEMDTLSPVIGVTPDMFTDSEREMMIDTIWMALDDMGAWVNDMVMDDDEIYIDFEGIENVTIRIDSEGTITFTSEWPPYSLTSVMRTDERGNLVFSKHDTSTDYWEPHDNTFSYYMAASGIEEGELVEKFRGYDPDNLENGYDCWHYTPGSPAGLLVQHGWNGGSGTEWYYWTGTRENGMATLVGKRGDVTDPALVKIWLPEEGDDWSPEWFIERDLFPSDFDIDLYRFSYGDPLEWTARGPMLRYIGSSVEEIFYVAASVDEVEDELEDFYPYIDEYEDGIGNGAFCFEGSDFLLSVSYWDEDVSRISLEFTGLRSYDAMKIRRTIKLPEAD